MENLKYLLDQTLGPGKERQAMIKLHEFKFLLVKFEKELAEFLDITYNFSQGQVTEKPLALMMVPLLQKMDRNLLHVCDPTGVTDLANNIRGLLANISKWTDNLTTRHLTKFNLDTPEYAAKDINTLN